MDDLIRASAVSLATAVRAGELSAVDITRAHLDRIAATDDRVGAFLTVTEQLALETAEAIDRAVAAGEEVGPLAGVPVAIKDLLTTEGVRTTCGSRILEHHIPPYDATVVRRVKEAGGVIIGKANMDEFAMGSSTENSAFQNTCNPWDLGRVPGGSSGGSVAAVAAAQAPVAIGTDTGGSIRQPAALCGLVGVKPTYGTVSRFGMVAFASSLDQAGPITRDVTDAAHVLAAIAGPDPRDSTALTQPFGDVLGTLEDGADGLRVGVVTDFMGEGIEPGVLAKVREAIEAMGRIGCHVEEVELPHARYGLPAYYLIAPSEASSNLARFDGVRYGMRVDAPTTEEMMAATRAAGFGPEVKRRIMIGTYALSSGYYDAYYAQASKVRTLIARDFATAFERFDVLVSPTSPSVAFRFGEKTDDPIAMYLNDVCSVPASLAGNPALSLPVGVDDDGLPVGLQMMAPMLDEATMLRAARALEIELDVDVRPSGANTIDAVLEGTAP